MSKTFEKPIVTVSGKKNLFKHDLHQRIIQDLPQEGVEWRRRLDSNSKSVYVDVEFVDFEVDNVERASERLLRQSFDPNTSITSTTKISSSLEKGEIEKKPGQVSTTPTEVEDSSETLSQKVAPTEDSVGSSDLQESISLASISANQQRQQQCDISNAFFTHKLLGRPILHTYWADKADFEAENQKSQFDDWIGQVQASTCTEWAIIIIEDGDFKAQLGTALFKSKLQSSASQSNISSSSISSTPQSSTASFLDRMKKGLSTIFQSDSNSDRWLTLINQDRLPDSKAQESYSSFLKKLRNLIIASFSKQIELFEEQLRVQREMREDKDWNFYSYFSMQEELAFAFEFLTLFDEALVQYDFLDALFTDYISSPNFLQAGDPLCDQWKCFESWHGLCLDMNCEHSKNLRRRIIDKKATLLDFRNYLFAKRCDLMFMQNQPWRVAASTSAFIQTCIREHKYLNIDVIPGALTCWAFISALEVLQKCECYSCTSTMENYSLQTVDIWNSARRKLLKLGHLCHRMPGMSFTEEDSKLIDKLLAGLGTDPHNGLSYQSNDISPQARLKDALASEEQFSKHLIEISELTLGTYKHIGRKRHALLVGRELADFYISQQNYSRASPFLVDMERTLMAENWHILLEDIRKSILKCHINQDKETNRSDPEP